MPMIDIKNVSKWYGSFQVLKNCSTSVEKGEVVVVCGPSGSGKSTLIKTVNALEPFQQGEIFVDGVNVGDPKTDLPKLRAHVGMVFQHFELFPHLTIIDNLTLAQIKVLGRGREEATEKGLKLLDRVGLLKQAPKFPGQLSGGQQQRVALARILCSEPEAILLDEPFSALDSYLKWNLEIELADLLATFNGPILWVSHDRDECYRNCRSVCVMEDGRTGEVTPMDEMIRHPGSVSAARLAGCKNFFAAEARDGKVYLPEWNVALPLAGMENTFTTIGIPDNAVTMSENGAMSCTVCRMILGVEENILLLRPEGSAEGAPMLRITVGHESDLQAGAAVRVALDYSKLLLL